MSRIPFLSSLAVVAFLLNGCAGEKAPVADLDVSDEEIAALLDMDLSPIPAPGPLQTAAQADLNGDGAMEDISLRSEEYSGRFRVSVGPASVEAQLQSGPADGFVIVDIDQSDQAREIAVHTPGPSSDDEYLVYGYDGEDLHEIARLSRWASFPGDGTVVVDDWMGFWTKRDVYDYDAASRSLTMRPRELYAAWMIEAEAEAIADIPLAARRSDDAAIIATAKAGTSVKVLAADIRPVSCKSHPGGMVEYFCDWYLLETHLGERGWARLTDLTESLQGLPWAD